MNRSKFVSKGLNLNIKTSGDLSKTEMSDSNVFSNAFKNKNITETSVKNVNLKMSLKLDLETREAENE